ncbi:MAG: SMP-30/gluconolactonase/LRE family protein [Chloroflexota bacterium]|nr:SMP-30/gluconolactonase/LRE family protein [Chloroflexota bacterium]
MPELQTLMTGLVFGESPRWHDNHLYCFDIATNEVFLIDLAGSYEVITREAAGIASIGFLDGALLIARRDGLIQRRQADGSFIAHTDLAGLSDKPWNDMVVDGRGNTYIGNIGFDFPGGEFRPGIVALVSPDGSARQVADGTAFANGMVVTPDNSTLIVAETYAHRLTAFDIAVDGSLSNRRLWADLPGSFPDGISLDAEGAIWYADVPGKRCVRVAQGGRVLQAIELDRGCFACALGGELGTTLFMMAAHYPPSAWGPDAPRTGQVLTTEAPAPRAGRP